MRRTRLAAAMIGWTIVSALVATMVVVIAALATGYRPVVVTTGSMGGSLPSGSLLVAAPSGEVEVGDVLVMRRDGRATVTHRVVGIEHVERDRYAITRGDANDSPDAEPYLLTGEELVGRWSVRHIGPLVAELADSRGVWFIAVLATVYLTASLLRRIWGTPRIRHDIDEDTRSDRDRRARRRRRGLVGAGAMSLGIIGGGMAWSLYVGTADVTGNVFSTRDCYDTQVAGVQHGQIVNAVGGVQTIGITAVDVSRSFLLVSTRSQGPEPADAMVRARLLDSTTIELLRRTDAVSPPPIVVDWTVVEYSCGVTVNRGITDGDDSSALDIPVPTSLPEDSFVTVSSVGDPGDTVFGGSHQVIAELTGPTTLRLRNLAPAVLPSDHSYAWQVVSFDDPGEVVVQRETVSVPGGTLTVDASIATVDPASTLVLATVGSNGSAPVADESVRVHLASSTSVQVSRQAIGADLEVHVQVVEFADGTTVEHGTIDFAPAQPARTVSISPVDASLTSALGTVQQPGAVSGGSTTSAAGGVIGEASATFEVTDPSTVTITRSSMAADASFGWQAVTWGGPTWWDPQYPHRRRIDVSAGPVDAPSGYSTPVVFDHAAMVSDGLSEASGADVRILRWDGSAWSELDRVLDDDSTWNDSATTIWFRTVVAVAATTTDSYWMYFGNDTPPPPLEDPENVWLLHEDFESGTLGDFEDRTAATGWYRALPWTRRIVVTVPAARVDADLADFPLLVRVTDADLAANAQTDGGDIRFTAADGATPLDHEVEAWDPGTGALTAWVRVPFLSSSTDTSIHLYYGAADSPDRSDVRGTWANDFRAVWHMAGVPSGDDPQVDDSTRFNHDGIPYGGMTASNVSGGQVGPALDFDGNDDRLDVGSWGLIAAETTISGWIRIDGFTDVDPRIVSKAIDPTDTREYDLAVTAAGEPRFRLRLDDTSVTLLGPPGAVGVGTWHHVTGVWDGSTMRIHVDGAEVASQPTVGLLTTGGGSPVTLGDVASGERSLDGTLDEVRIESVARSQAWIDAVVANQTPPATFAVAGSPEAGLWFDQGDWAFRKPITISGSSVTGTHGDFALLVQLTDPALAASAQPDGDDIVFTDADGLTRLDHEIESFNSGTGELTAWVRLPVLDDTTGASLYMYFGNPGAGDQQDPAAVFGPHADVVAHLAG